VKSDLQAKRRQGKSIKKENNETALAQSKDRVKSRLKELMTVTLTMTDALSKLLIEKGIITHAEVKKKPGKERAAYQKILKSIEQ
jgi:hypothetical protein